MSSQTKAQTKAKSTFNPAVNGLLQRAAINNAPKIEMQPKVSEVLCSPGQPLDATIRALMEPRFGFDFSQVRVHTGMTAQQSAKDVKARAYTVGHDIVFGEGQFKPRTHYGQQLIAHELTHVAQANPARPPSSVDALESEAKQAAIAVSNGKSIPPVQGSARGLTVPLRQPEDDFGQSSSLGSSTVSPIPSNRPGHILREYRAAEGVVIEIEIGRSVQRLGLEQTLPSGTQVDLAGWHRAHSTGAGFGAESGQGIRYAPPEVNLGYQNSGVEKFIRELNTQKTPDVRLILRTVTETHPNSLRLKSITYRLSAARGQGRPVDLFEVDINIQNTTTNPRVTLGRRNPV